MKITPVDVAHKTFNRSFYGLDQKEVLSYLQAISEQLETLFKERNDLREKLREREIQIAEYKERDQLLKNTLTTAAQMSEKIREDADKRAEMIVHEARVKSDEIQRSTHDSLRKAYSEINDLKALRVQFETNMRALAQAHIALIDEGKKYMGMPTDMSSLGPAHSDKKMMNETVDSKSDKLTSEISPLAMDII